MSYLIKYELTTTSLGMTKVTKRIRKKKETGHITGTSILLPPWSTWKYMEALTGWYYFCWTVVLVYVYIMKIKLFFFLFPLQFEVTWSLCGDLHMHLMFMVHLIVLYCDGLVLPKTHRNHKFFSLLHSSEVTVAAEINVTLCFFCKMFFNKWQGINKDVMFQLAMWVVSVIGPEAV